MLKYYNYGASIKEVADEREKQTKIRDLMPGAPLAKLMTRQMVKNQDPALYDRMRDSAIARAHPNTHKEPSNEIERLVADEPKSSAQVIGHHKVPSVHIPPRKRTEELSEIERMRTVFPGRESGMVGFHHDFGLAKQREAAEAEKLVGRLTVQEVKKDAELVRALSLLKGHAISQSGMKDVMGNERGIVRKR